MRPEKANIVSDLSEKLNRSPFLLVADYQRMNVDQFGELRNRLAPAGAEVRVVKNSFLKRAMADSGMPDVADKLTGQTAIVMGENDVAPVAKILKLFAAEFKIATLKIGVVDKAVLSTSDVEALAELPSREILLSLLLGLLLAPATRLVRVLNEPASAFARLLKAKEEKGEALQAATAAPAPETPAPAPSAEEAPTPEAPEAKEEAPVAETKQEAPVAETQEEAPVAEQTPEAAAENPTAESTTGETATETPV
ncbi:MAG TPA: 50S ribosomal protein L10 [Chthoniobacterales bacterium]